MNAGPASTAAVARDAVGRRRATCFGWRGAARAAGALALALCTLPAAAQTAASGAGATGVFPAIAAWAVRFEEKTGASVAYRPLGTAGGLEQLDDETVDFALVDAPLDAAHVAGQSYLQFPLLVDAVVPIANLPGVSAGIVLDAATLGGLLSGTIGRWSDPRIATLNPGVTLPDLAVTPVVRGDPSGETARLTGYLTAGAPAFAAAIGAGESVAWPVGKSERGGAAVAATVAATPGAIGYVAAADLAAATKPSADASTSAAPALQAVRLKSADGGLAAFSPADLAITAEAAAQAAGDPAGFAAALAERRGGGDWPLAYPVMAVMAQVPEDPEAAVVALKFFAAVLADDAGVEAAGLAPLPAPVATAVEAGWAAGFRSNDKPLWPAAGP